MRTKRILTLLLVVALTIVCGVTNVAAQDNANSFQMAVEVTSSTALTEDACLIKPGDSIEVSVMITENTGLKNVFAFDINYDAEALDIVLTENGTVDYTAYNLLGADTAENVLLPENTTGVVRYKTINLDNTIKPTGKLLTLKFIVKDTFEGNANLTFSGYKYNITFADGSFGTSPENTVSVKDSNTPDYEGATIIAHNFGDPIVEEADCTKEGTITYSCKDCDYKKVIKTADKKDHTPKVVPAVDATCTETGLTEGSVCEVCGETLTAQTEVEAKGHAYGDWEVEKEATEEKEGSKVKTCANCGDKITETIPKLDAEKSNAWVWILVISLVVVLGGGFCLYWFVLRKKK